MKLSSASLTALLSLAWAHGNDGGQHIPKIVGGRRLLSEGSMSRRHAVAKRHTAAHQRGDLKERQDDDDDGRCGPGIGSCASGDCCSYEGCVSVLPHIYSESKLTCSNSWCGKGKEYCSAPDCQINYGSGCDAVCATPRTLPRTLPYLELTRSIEPKAQWHRYLWGRPTQIWERSLWGSRYLRLRRLGQYRSYL